MTAKASKITGDGRYYFSTELAGVEQEAEPIERGFWAGVAAEDLLLKDRPVVEKEFLNLFAGRSPDGRLKFVRNADSRGRQSAHEVLLSPDKSIATVWAAADGSTQAKIIDSFFAAARVVLAELEKTCGFARMGAGGKEVVKAEQIFAVFLHRTSRAQDPQPHFHIVRPNLGRCPDGQYRALISHDVYSAQRRLNALFNLTLANELEKRVGLKVVLSGQACAIEGVPKTLLTEFSTRRQQILAHTEAMGFDSPQSNQIAAYATRPEKVEFPLDALHKMWRETAGRHRFDVEKLSRLSAAEQTARALVPEPLRLMAVMQEAGRLLTRASAAFGEQAFLSAAYLAGIGKGVTPEQVRSAVTAVFERPRAHGLVPAGTSDGKPLFHTKAQVKHEARLDQLTRRWPNTRFALDHDKALKAIMTLQQEGLPPEELASAARLTLRPQGLGRVDRLSVYRSRIIMDAI